MSDDFMSTLFVFIDKKSHLITSKPLTYESSSKHIKQEMKYEMSISVV